MAATVARFAGCRDLVDMLERLPAELEAAIMRRAGPLTLLMHGRLPQPMSAQTLLLPSDEDVYFTFLAHSNEMVDALGEIGAVRATIGELMAGKQKPLRLLELVEQLVDDCPAAGALLLALVQRLFPKWRTNPRHLELTAVAAAAAGDAALFKQLLDAKPISNVDGCLRIACRVGCAPIVRLLLRGTPPPTSVLYNAVCSGNADVLEAVLAAAPAADEQRPVTMLDVLLRAPAELRVPGVMDAVAEAGNLALLAQLHARGFSGTSEIMVLAARSGHLDVVGLLHAHGFPCTIDCLESSVSYHRTNVERFLFEHCNDILFANALKDIHIEFWEAIADEIHTGVDPAACECGLLSRAIKGAGAKLVSLLDRGHTVNDDAARIAGSVGDVKIAQILGPHLSPAQWQFMHDAAQQSKHKQLLAWIESSKPSAGNGRKRPAGSDATASRPARRKDGGRSK
nr:hypothetical protein HK105_003386 [Polyrhizophydium stewartii]